MFERILAPANPDLVKTWLIWSGVGAASEGVASISTFVALMNKAIPAKMIHEEFVYMSLAIGLIAVLPLVAFPRVISLSLSQIGVATSLMYLGYAMTGAFPAGFQIVVIILQIVVALVFLIIFSSGPIYLAKEKCWSDFAVSLGGLIVFFCLWLYPIVHSLL